MSAHTQVFRLLSCPKGKRPSVRSIVFQSTRGAFRTALADALIDFGLKMRSPSLPPLALQIAGISSAKEPEAWIALPEQYFTDGLLPAPLRFESAIDLYDHLVSARDEAKAAAVRPRAPRPVGP